ncbi:unnamed protein product [Rotaria sp. Silwood2]|nr:unnamed protein product [Rotaria sp. Silwood2]CAF3972361.1 unnamed protein product [Rotaria sp. Silwood2]CAF4478149.1 unnamed protein product [Rotaria sp. Silwood2]
MCTILMIAVLEGRINLVKMLLSKFRKLINLETKGAIIFNSGLTDGVTALLTAVVLRNFDMVKLLIENGAEVNTVNNYGATPLHVASSLGRADIVKYLIEEAQGDISRVNKGNVTCLNIAGHCGHLELMKYLLQQPNIDVNHQSHNGYTTLHWAVERNNIEIIKLLLSYNARIDIKNAKNMTSLEMAAESTDEEAVNYMLSIEDLIGVKEKIEVLELLGASFACRNKETYNLEKAYEYIMQAMKLRTSSGNLKTNLTPLVQPIAAYNYRPECVSIAELESIC